MPDTLRASNASDWSDTPGRSTMMFLPSTRTSGSAMPKLSSWSRMRSRTTIEFVLVGRLGGGVDHREATLEVETRGWVCAGIRS